jgi:arginine deiminase
MNLAIQRLQQLAKETEVQLEQARDAHKVHERTAAESSAKVTYLTALLADLKAAVAALPVVTLKVVDPVVTASVTHEAIAKTPAKAEKSKR